VAGNVMDKSLAELFNCHQFKKIREYLAMGHRDKIPLCSRCNFLRDEEDLKRNEKT
jgi:hypothetical protein